jgi:hypothetical protein
MDQELVQYLEERFDRQEQRFQALLDNRFTTVDQRFATIDRRFEEMTARMEERFEEVKRHTGVLVEGLRHEVQLVAEGLLMHIEVRHREDREYFDRKFEDAYVLIRSSHDHLQQQQDQLRQRVDNLDRKSPN